MASSGSEVPDVARRPALAALAAHLSLALGVALGAACVPHDNPPRSPSSPTAASGVTTLGSYDLPRGPSTRELSGIAWDEATRTLYAIQDEIPFIVPLSPGDGYRSWSVGAPIPVKVNAPWDGEGIAVTATSFFVASEIGPHVFELDRAGTARSEVSIPEHYAACSDNQSLESLSLTPDQRYLFTANEGPLGPDTPKASTREGATVRILRIERATGAQAEFAYRTDAIFAPGEGGMIGVADLAAISEADLLVLERAFVPQVGNRVRVYRTTLRGANDVRPLPALSAATPVADKRLLVDLATIEGQYLQPPGSAGMPHGLVPNYEGLALGPKLADGRQVLFLAADDNALQMLAPRVLTLAIELGGRAGENAAGGPSSVLR